MNMAKAKAKVKLKAKSKVNRKLLVAIPVLVLFQWATVWAESSDNECNDLRVIGQAENVSFPDTKLRLKARIDTGAETASLGVKSHEIFERDGEKWVKFEVEDRVKKTSVEFERPLKRIASIKRHGASDTKRPVVEMKIKIAGEELERQFTLADRSKFEYPVLIGRNVLKNKFVVDVSQKYSSGSAEESEE